MATAVSREVALPTGFTMPSVGLGVYRSAPGQETYAAVLGALRLGYRHIDTAQVYGNEADVGRAVRDSGVPREEVFVTTKVWRDAFGFEHALASVRSSLARSGLAYLDCALLHCPGADPGRREGAWRGLEAAQAQGLVRTIGVSNFSPAHIAKLNRTAAVKPAVNQVEVHPWLQRRELVAACRAEGIVVQAYSPLGKAARLSDPPLAAVAQRLGVSPAQVLVRWSLQKGLVPLPKSVHPDRQASNLDVFSFSLSPEDVAALDGLEEGLVTGWDPVAHDPV
ncbi:hypothetical protein HYH03_002391 [Edaphochlamys debaryana]|uniref:NADP-dependent oxidoreductase domain-containing protein n=1 Tax=Edaphochlamys debaryana TaxID=47281 RepID=A0A835YKN0_9CHLO|nr:hypothetical protein HYH03_002391 [Edaphochlamys debaryana]|eukprot:KAG2499444.1 hypothetical protein HYH03_002391 [Edaphochlamys debaryana]